MDVKIKISDAMSEDDGNAIKVEKETKNVIWFTEGMIKEEKETCSDTEDGMLTVSDITAKVECVMGNSPVEIKSEYDTIDPEVAQVDKEGMIKEEKETCSDTEDDMPIFSDITAKVECVMGNSPVNIKSENDTIDPEVAQVDKVGSTVLDNVSVDVLDRYNIAEKKQLADTSNESEFYCQTCGKNYPNRRKFKQHILTHLNVKKFECAGCDKRFRLKCQLNKHVVLHDDLKMFMCNQCGRSFKQKVTLKAHMKRHENIKEFKCEFCGKCFIQKYELKKHRVVHVRRFPCRECGKYFFTEENLKEHSQEHSVESMIAINHLSSMLLKRPGRKPGKRIRRTTTNSVTTIPTTTNSETVNLTQVYVKEELEELMYDNVLLEKNSGVENENIHEDKNENIHALKNKLKHETSAKEKSSEFSNKNDIKDKTEFSVDDLQNRHQSSIMDTYSSLVNTYHNVINEKQSTSREGSEKVPHYGEDFVGNNEIQEDSFYCQKCDKYYATRKKFIKHIAIHKGVKRFECVHCNKLFRVKSDLDKHIVNHNDTKVFKCDECGKGFKHKYNLNQHKYIHTGVKNFKCSMCEKYFSLKANLKTHLTATHLRIKKFKCEVCGKEYGHSSTLRSHIASHIGM